MSTTTPARATVSRVAKELSPVTGRAASSIANATGLSPSTARRCLTALREEGRARRDEVTANWFAISATTQTDEVTAHIDETLGDFARAVSSAIDTADLSGHVPERREPNPFPGEGTHVPRTAPPRPEVEQANQLLETGIGPVLEGWGLTERLVNQDSQLYLLLKREGPLSRTELESKLINFSEWSLRRLTTGKHQGRTVGDPLVEAVGRGDSRTYRVVS